MTPEQLAAIAARNAARTQGKWQAVALGNDDYPSEVWFADNMRVCLMPSNTGQRKPKDADFIAHASEDIPSLLSEVARLIAALAEAEKLIYAPGLWHCPKCNFTLMQSNLNAVDGTVTARDTPGDKCPNCQSPLWRVSWKQEATKAREVAEQYFDEKKEAEKRGYDAAKEQAAQIIDNLVAHLNLEQFLLVLRDKEKAAEISQAVIAILECEATAIRAMVKP